MPQLKTSVFTRTAKQPETAMRGQKLLVFASLEGRPEGATLAQVTDDIVKAGLVTRQDPDRISLYYLAILRKEGFITATESQAPGAEFVAAVNENTEQSVIAAAVDLDNEEEDEDEEETEDETEDEEEEELV